MRTIEIFLNYGVLANEKRNVYTYGGPHSQGICSDKMTVVIPDGWETHVNYLGNLMLKSPWGWEYEPNEVLKDKNGCPTFSGLDKDGHPFYYYLYTEEELQEKAKKEKTRKTEK